MTHRFYLPADAFQGEQVLFPPETSRQIARVLRLKAGAEVIVFQGDGYEARVALTEVDAGQVRGQILAREANRAEAPVGLHLFVGLTQREKFEWVLQKCTEVGVSSFVPVLSERSLVQSQADFDKKRARWERILQEAAEQSGRGKIPLLAEPLAFERAIQQIADMDAGLLAWEEEKSRRLHGSLPGLAGAGKVALLIGPEGGFSPGEARAAEELGWQLVSLGPRILRMETAAVVASALVIDLLEG